MKIITTIAEMRQVRRGMRIIAQRLGGQSLGGQTLGLVPTMGALHAGHLSLVAAARAACDAVVVSIFVNPTQFAPHEDFARYPRTFDSDCTLLKDAGADFVFAPSVEDVYPDGPKELGTIVVVEGISDRLDGASRPGHFSGVATVVSKLLHIVAPDTAFFGRKDAAQLAVLRQMVRDLNFDVELIACPIVREPDGLACSSRNHYLTNEQRRSALVLHRALRQVEHRAAAGEAASAALLASALEVLADEPEVKLDYLAIVDPDTLLPVENVRTNTLVAIAAIVGATRLIDNVLL